MREDLPPLPLGEPEFSNLRTSHCLYIDKTGSLLQLIGSGRWYFFARPRRFGKSLTVSTLAAMFEGRAELFSGLAAREWVCAQAAHPAPVLRLDLSEWGAHREVEDLNDWLVKILQANAERFHLALPKETHCEAQFANFLRAVAPLGQVVVLIDEYDAPILRNIAFPEKMAKLRDLLRSFYSVLKSCAASLRFVFITGIAKLVHAGIFSSLNNLNDISIDTNYGTLAGYTQEEIDICCAMYIEQAAHLLSVDAQLLRKKIRTFYDGYSFDGLHKVYNPFSILNFFAKNSFDNYWYESGSATFLEEYLKNKGVDSLDRYHILPSTKNPLPYENLKKNPRRVFCIRRAI